MIQLSLADINQKSPYQVVKAPNGDFFFATSLDIHYLISFEEEEPLGQCDTYQFVIQKLDMQRSPHDPKVEQTILDNGTRRDEVPAAMMIAFIERI
jgi:hypothetical protein